MRTALLVLVLLLAPACVIARTSENEPLSPGTLQSLRPGVTTAREVVQLLGAPVDVVQLGKRSAYRYQFTRAKRAGLLLVAVGLYNLDVRSDRAWVFFDENQVLTHVGVTLEGDEAEYAMPWEDLHD
jgi:outer membrane protein assembly factor BamE (lipoprotein component of BamABCDE complex)